MGKTTLNKLEHISSILNLSIKDQNELTDIVINNILAADCHGIQVNAISYHFIIDVLRAMTGITVSPSNLSYYKHNSQCGDIVTNVAIGLQVPVFDWVKCKITASSHKLKIEPLFKGPIAAYNMLVGANARPETVAAHYQILADDNWKVGDRRNWIKPSLLRWLDRNGVYPAFPISHCRPTELRKVFNYLDKLSKQAHRECDLKQTLTSWIDDKLLDFCNTANGSKINQRTPWLPVYNNLPLVKFIDVVEASDRLVPYLYCRRFDVFISKIGKANNSLRFKATDLGIVICLKRETDEVMIQCEYIILNELSKRGIAPLDGTRERFRASIWDLCKVVLDICESTPFLSSKIISITATNQ
ncbi:MAG: hypothetical protein V7733_16130 [Paraglaciecola polaris]|uniref:hypothetical protein n=1 Tax=Paraglaciecola polaris TaxID=222814 RepID=UPI003002B0AD